MNPTDYQLRSPEYAQYYYKQAAEDNQRAYDQQQRAELAKWAKTSGYLGNEAVDYTGMPTTPGTGIYAEGFNPDRREMMLRNQQMLMSENDAMQAQGMSQMGGMQDSRNTGINQIDMEKWKKVNTPQKAKSPYEHTITGEGGRQHGYNVNTGTYEMIPNSPIKRKGTPLVDMSQQVRTAQQEAILADQKAYGDAARDYVMQVGSDARNAQANKTDLNRMLKLLDTVGTGALEEDILKVKQLGRTLGFDVDERNIANAEQLRVLLGDQVMARVEQTKGAVSEREMQLFTSYSANYGNSVQGNKLILEFQLLKAERDIEIGEMVRNLRKQGKSTLDIEENIHAYVQENPLLPGLSDDENTVDFKNLKK